MDCLGVEKITMNHQSLEYCTAMTKIAIENGQLQWMFPLKIVVFYSDVSLPGGITCNLGTSILFLGVGNLDAKSLTAVPSYCRVERHM